MPRLIEIGTGAGKKVGRPIMENITELPDARLLTARLRTGSVISIYSKGLPWYLLSPFKLGKDIS